MSPTPLVFEMEERLDSLAREWDALATEVGATPFQRPGWIRAWHDAFGNGRLVIIAGRRGGRLVGVLPLEQRRGALRAPTNVHSPDFDALATEPSVVLALFRRIFAERPRVLRLAPLDASGPTDSGVREEAARAGYVVRRHVISTPPYISLEGRPAGGRSRNLRHDVERRLRRLCDVGAVSVQVSGGKANLEELLDEAFALELAGWKGTEGTAIASQRSTAEFYTEVARWGASQDLLRLAFLRLDGRAIAFQLDLESPRRYYSLKIGYDSRFAPFSPGKVLAYSMVARAAKRELASYELLGADEPWKERWTDDVRERVALVAFAPSAAGRLSRIAFVHGRAVARRVPFARRLRATVRR